jgi:hypothetical protein
VRRGVLQREPHPGASGRSSRAPEPACCRSMPSG